MSACSVSSFKLHGLQALKLLYKFVKNPEVCSCNILANWPCLSSGGRNVMLERHGGRFPKELVWERGGRKEDGGRFG
eukprot:778117-Pelagomonas_calceolata.AAC.2